MKKLFAMLLCLCILAGAFTACAGNDPDLPDSSTSSTGTSGADVVTTAPSGEDDTKNNDALKAALKAEFLKAADEVIVGEDSVTFKDATSTDGSTVTIKKNPKNVVNLYASFTTLWYEAGGSVNGCIGGSSSQALYSEYIGRDITTDEGMTVVATTSSGKNGISKRSFQCSPTLSSAPRQ